MPKVARSPPRRAEPDTGVAGFREKRIRAFVEMATLLTPAGAERRHQQSTAIADTAEVPAPRQSLMPFSAGCTRSPPSTFKPLARIASLRQFFCARRVTYGRIAAEIACVEVCGTAPGMLVTQKWVTPST